LRQLVAAQTEAIGSADFARFFALDEAMHRRLMEMAGRASVWPMIAGAKAQLDRVRYLSLKEPGWSVMILAQHAALIERIAAGDAEGARAVMQEHLRTAFAAIDRIAAENADFFEGRGTGR
jgi:DNA-binding GntR family transcriptional regulator